MINISDFSKKNSLKKLQIFITTDFHLVQLLDVLNNNWILLDMIDNVNITWLENFYKKEWIIFISEIKKIYIS